MSVKYATFNSIDSLLTVSAVDKLQLVFTALVWFNTYASLL